jgi:hypothetical protein
VDVEYVTVIASVALLPAASCAVTVMMFDPPCSVIDGTVHAVVPLDDPPPPRLFDHVTTVTPRLSEAVPPSETVFFVVAYVDAEVGPVMLIAGRVVSPAVDPYVTVNTSVAVLPAASRAVSVITFVPL